MASFNTHLTGAALVGGVASTTALLAGWSVAAETPLLFVAGVLGGILPDIDAKDSVPIRIFFHLLALLAAFAVLFRMVGVLSLAELLLLWLAVWWLVRFPVSAWFLRYTVHRGVFHSLLAVVFFTLGTVAASHHLGGASPLSSWLLGVAVGIGYLTHLALDELASLDFLHMSYRGSLGTALKPCSTKAPQASCMLLLMSLGAGLAVPAPAPVWTALRVQDTGGRLAARLLPPPGQWFRALLPGAGVPVLPASP
jgi:hypothetical protein